MGFIVRRLLKRSWKRTKRKDILRMASLPSVAGVTAVEGISYCGDNDPWRTLNLYFPENTQGLLPAIVDIHGGGWMYGDRNLNRHYAMWLASRGYAVMTMSYRLLPATDLRGQLSDVLASIDWLCRHGAAHHFDMNQLLLTGDSAGAHLAGLVTCLLLSPALQKNYELDAPPAKADALCLSHGVCDVHALGQAPSRPARMAHKEMLTMLLGKNPTTSPLHDCLSLQQAAEGITLPPTLIISSAMDVFHPQSLAVYDYLQKRGIPSQLKLWLKSYELLHHVFHISYPFWPESMESNELMLDFFQTALDKRKYT